MACIAKMFSLFSLFFVFERSRPSLSVFCLLSSSLGWVLRSLCETMMSSWVQFSLRGAFEYIGYERRGQRVVSNMRFKDSTVSNIFSLLCFEVLLFYLVLFFLRVGMYNFISSVCRYHRRRVCIV